MILVFYSIQYSMFKCFYKFSLTQLMYQTFEYTNQVLNI